MRLEDLDTPALLVDLDRLERNIVRMQEAISAHGVALRPHTKTHKIPAIARWQVAAGAQGITVATVGEAEVMMAAGLADVFVAREIVGRHKLARLARLARQGPLSVAVDSVVGAEMLNAAVGEAGVQLEVLLEIDVGSQRCGVPPAEVVPLAEAVVKMPHLRLKGVFTHEGRAYGQGDPAAIERYARHEGEGVVEARDRLAAAGIEIEVVSVGSTPTAVGAAAVPGVTESRPGNYVFMDLKQVDNGVCTLDDCALTVLATVFSKPAPNRLSLDAGSKALSADTGAFGRPEEGFGLIKNTSYRLWKLNEEHGILVAEEPVPFGIGDRVEIIPNHACLVPALHEVAYGVRNGQVEVVWPIAGRGKF